MILLNALPKLFATNAIRDFNFALNLGITMKYFAIIGAGFTGTATINYLLNQIQNNIIKATKIKIIVFEKNDELGPGFPYSNKYTETTHLLNTPANYNSVLANNNLDFFIWLKQNHSSLLKKLKLDNVDLYNRFKKKPKQSECYPRIWLGLYLKARFQQAIHDAKNFGIVLDIFTNTEVINITESNDSLTITYKNNISATLSSIKVDHVFLTTGHWQAYPLNLSSTHYVPSIYDKAILKNTCLRANKIGILGASLSALDAAFSIMLYKKTLNVPYQITFLSRRGRLPTVRGKQGKYINQFFTQSNIEKFIKNNQGYAPLTDILKLFIQDLETIYQKKINLEQYLFGTAYNKDTLKKEIEIAKYGDLSDGSCGWQTVLLKHFPTFIYAITHLNAEDKKLFHEKYDSVFFDFNSPIPLYNAERIWQLMDNNILNIITLGENYTISETEDKKFLISSTQLQSTLLFDALIDCRGFTHDVRSADMKLASNLLDSGTIRTITDKYTTTANSNKKLENYYLSYGIEINPTTFHIIDKNNIESKRISYVGIAAHRRVLISGASVCLAKTKIAVDTAIKNHFLKTD